MPQFEYLVKDRQGHDKSGIEEASDVHMVVQGLREKGYLIIRVNEAKPKMGAFSVSLRKKAPRGKGGRVKLDDLVVFSRQTATLIDAGVPMLQSLEILAEQTEKMRLRQVVEKLHEDVRGGKSLSEALEKHPKVFPAIYVYMIRAGEKSGHLPEILDRLAGYMEKTSALQKKIRSALTYPSAVTALALVITIGLLTFVIPKFAEIYTSIDATLPAPTQFLIDLSDTLRENFFFLCLGAFIVGGTVTVWKKTNSGALVWDRMKLKFPIFGPLFLKVAISKFTRTFSTLIKSGIPILATLEIVAHTSGNRHLGEVILGLRSSVSKGEGISGPLLQSPLFPPMVSRMIAVGEETGELEQMLMKIADFYDSQVDSAVDTLTSLIEPLVIAFLGIVIGGIVFAMFLPILTLTQAIH